MEESGDKANHEFHKSVKSTPFIILPNSNFNKQINEVNAQYSQLENASSQSVSQSIGQSVGQSVGQSIACVPKLSVHYIVSLNNDSSIITSCKQLENESKLETNEGEKKCFISLPLEHESDGHLLKINQSIANQRLLISPTDFLTLSEEGICHNICKNPAVKKDVSLSSSNIEMIKRNNIENNLAICLDRYCESPIMLENHKDSQLICEDDTSCNGRNSRLSETAEDISTDELFANTFATDATDQSSSLREVVTPVDGECARNTPLSTHKDILVVSNKNKNFDNILMEEEKQSSEQNDAIETKPILAILDPLDADSTHCDANNQNSSESSFAFITPQTAANVASNQTGLSLASVDIKLLQTGILAKDSILLANLAAALPSSLTSRQIALQVIREDGTSLVLPLNTKHETSDSVAIKDSNSDLPVSTSVLLAEVVSPNESMRPFKCELCNSTFTRLGNYTRHKKIHSYPSKEDQRFRCEICSKSFIQRCDLARHLHIHRGTEPHRCPQCGKGYIRHSDLVTHQRFHNKEKPFSCPHCSKGFCQRGDLNRHLRSIHLQLKPILCSHCHKKFAKEETLLRHMNATHRDVAEDSTLN